MPPVTDQVTASADAIGHSGELRNETLERGIWLAVTHDTHIQADIDNLLQRPSHGVVDPLRLVAKRSAAQPGQKQHVRARVVGVDNGSPQRRFIGTFKHQRREGFPALRWNVGVAHREC